MRAMKQSRRARRRCSVSIQDLGRHLSSAIDVRIKHKSFPTHTEVGFPMRRPDENETNVSCGQQMLRIRVLGRESTPASEKDGFLAKSKKQAIATSKHTAYTTTKSWFGME